MAGALGSSAPLFAPLWAAFVQFSGECPAGSSPLGTGRPHLDVGPGDADADVGQAQAADLAGVQPATTSKPRDRQVQVNVHEARRSGV